MSKRIVDFALALIFGLALAAANHSARAWGLYEIYSNADGSVQFLQFLVNPSIGGREFVGLKLTARDGRGAAHEITLPNRPPLDADGGAVLVATQGFADLNLVRPDYVIPNGFLFVPNGSIDVDGSPTYVGATSTNYRDVPTDGLNSRCLILCEDPIGWAEPSNSAGEHYSFTVVTVVPKLSGLWVHAPAGSESGWAISIEHQRDTVFAAWATYDIDGSPTWFVIPAAAIDVHVLNAFDGGIYRTTGPPFNSAPFDASAVTVNRVGNVRFLLPFDHNGIDQNDIGFQNSIDGNLPQREIARFEFADPVPVCRGGAMPAPTPNFQGLWWSTSEPGSALHLSHQGEIIFVIWYTYDAAGKATWLTMTATMTAPTTYAGTLYRTTGPAYNAATFDPSLVTRTEVGGGTLTFSDRDNGTFSYTRNAISGSKNITRFTFAEPPTVCN